MNDNQTIRRLALAIDEYTAAAVKAEREACAKTDPLTVECGYCQSKVGEACWLDGEGPMDGSHNTRISAAIRARGESDE